VKMLCIFRIMRHNFTPISVISQFHFNFSSGGGGRGPAAASCP
jgi:hypothetical protein